MEPYLIVVDGRTFEVPRESVSNKAEAEAAVRAYVRGDRVTETRPATVATRGQDVLAGLSQGLSLGASDEILGRAEAFLRNVPAANTIARRRADIDAAKRRSPVGYAIPEIGGAAVTGLGLLAATRGRAGANMVPAAIANNPFLRATAIGAGEGALAGFNVGEGDAAQRAPGAVVGGVVGGGVGAGSQFVAPKFSAAATRLYEKYGIPYSPESLGKSAKAVTQFARQIPFVGGPFRRRAGDTMADFNTAAVNQVLKPIGKEATQTVSGREAYKEAKRQVSAAYDELLDGVGEVDLETNLSGLLARRIDDTELDPKEALELQEITASIDRFLGGGRVSGRDFKSAEKELNAAIKRYRKGAKSDDPVKARKNELILNELQTLKTQLRQRMDAAAGGNFGQKLTDIDFSFKMLQTLRDLATQPGSAGRFTPAQLRRAVGKQFKGDGDQVAQGTAPMMDLADTADEVLSDLDYSTVRDQGLMRTLELLPALGSVTLAGLDARDRELSSMGFGAGGLGLLALLTRPGAYRNIAPAAVRGGRRLSTGLEVFNPYLAMQAGKLANQGNN